MEMTCHPSFMIKNASVTRSAGQNDNLSIIEQTPRLLLKTNPWGGFTDLEQLLNNNCTHRGCLNTFLGGYCETSCKLNTTTSNNKGAQSENIALDGFLAIVLKMNIETNPAGVAEHFFNSTYIDENMDNAFVSYGALLGYLLFSDEANGVTENATVTVKNDRLLVTSTVAHSMTGLLGTCSILSLAMIALLPKRDTLPLRPATIMDMAILTRQSQAFMQSLRGLGASGENELRYRISPSGHSPRPPLLILDHISKHQGPPAQSHEHRERDCMAGGRRHLRVVTT
ncbi:hypothetical protein F4860DRAFT_492689 [Xylaria cubensis]|nr:hypothetical protein F4860DRAFT_492689 [Xylaria cubensis]